MANQSKLSILITTSFQGKGATAAKESLSSFGVIAKKTAKDAEGFSKSLTKLDKSMVSTGKSAKNTTTSIGKTDTAIKKAGKSAKKGSKDVGAMGKSFQDLGRSIGAIGALTVFKKAFDFSKEGAQIDKTASRFDTLAQSIDSTSVSLITRLRSATQGASNDLDLMRDATALMTQQLANTDDEVVELFDIVAKLKKPTDDMSESMERFGLLLANTSILRLDTFGISANNVKARIKELQAETKGMTRETAFLQATMEEARKTIDRLGGDTIQTASGFDRLQTRAENVGNTFKTTLADGLEPYADILAGSYKSALEDAVKDNTDFGNSLPTVGDFQGLIAGLDGVNTILGRASGAFEDQRRGLVKLIAQNADFSGSNEQLLQSIADLTGEEVTLINGRVKLGNITIARIESLKVQAALTSALTAQEEALSAAITTQTKAEERRSEATKARNQVAIDANAISREGERRSKASIDLIIARSKRLSEERGINEDLADKIAQTANQREIGNLAVFEANKALREQIGLEKTAAQRTAQIAEQQRQYNATLGDFVVDAVNANEETSLFTTTLDKLGTQYSTVGGRTREQNEDLSRLRSAYSRAQRNIRDYELGLKGTGLETDKLNEKIEEQQAIMANAGTQIAQLEGVTGDLRSSQVDAIFSQEKINNLMFESADAFGASGFALAAHRVRTGEWSEAQAEAAIKSSLVRAQVLKLGEAYANGEISLNEYFEGTNEIIESVSNLSISVDETTGKITLLSDAELSAAQNANLMGEELGIAAESVNSVDTTAATKSIDILGGSLEDSGSSGRFLLDTLNELDGKETSATHTTQFNQIGTPATGTATSGGLTEQDAPKRQGGGAVSIGRPVVVGEMGAELFVPTMSGNIVPSNQLGGNVTIHMNINTPLAATPAAIAGEVSRRIGARG